MTKFLFRRRQRRHWRSGWLWGVGLLLAGVACNASAQILPSQARALSEALRLAAPQTGIANDGLYSEWKIKPGNIARWSKRCTGDELTPTLFESNPGIAGQVVECVMGDVLRDQYRASGNGESVAVRRAASWWMTGDPEQYDSGNTAAYTEKVLNFYRTQLRAVQAPQ
jgi:hypothetical protein